MSTRVFLFDFDGPLRIECGDDEATLWIRSRDDTVSVELTPHVIEQMEAALVEARKFRAMEKAA